MGIFINWIRNEIHLIGTYFPQSIYGIVSDPVITVCIQVEWQPSLFDWSPVC